MPRCGVVLAVLVAVLLVGGTGAAADAGPARTPTVVVVVPATDATAGNPFEVVVRVIPHGPGLPTGSITLSDTSGPLCVVVLDATERGTCDVTEAASGRYRLTGTYSGDLDFAPSTTTADVVVHGTGRVRITITPPPVLRIGDPARFDVTVAAVGSSATPSGTVQLTDVYAEVCDTTLVAGHGSCTLTPVIGGPRTVQALYSGDGDFAPAQGETTIDVGTRPSAVSAVAAQPITVDEPVVVHIEVTDARRDIGLTPSGRVEIEAQQDLGDGRVELDACDGQLDRRGRATCTLTVHHAGIFSTAISYVGDEQFSAATRTVDLTAVAPSSTSTPPPGGVLANTGARSTDLLLLGVLTLGAGVLLTLAGRRRPPTSR